jgi:hypothetical protein
MSIASRGIAKTQLTGGAASAAGSLALISNTFIVKGATFGVTSLSVNLTTEGTYDWGLSTANLSTYLQLTNDAGLWRWKRSRGGLLVPPAGIFAFGPSEITVGGLLSGPIAFSANAGDDAGGPSSGNNASYPLTNSKALYGQFQNNTTVVPLGYGVGVRIPLAANQLRTINLYCGVRCQLGKAITGTITAHFMDGSAGDVSTTITSNDPGSTGALYSVYKVVFQAKPAQSTILLLNLIVTATTGIVTQNGDAIVMAGVTIS